ncbi:MAG: response regulator [Proteobacteria bacterium]|nr:response regulator [Pseudomonadota bacterium]
MTKILVVDDERDILDEIEETLTEEGYEVICAAEVNAALEALRTHSDINLVVTDLKMPGKSGADLINEARTDFERDISFIIISGHGSPSVETFGLDIDQFIFHKKPLDIDRFLESIETEITRIQNNSKI